MTNLNSMLNILKIMYQTVDTFDNSSPLVVCKDNNIRKLIIITEDNKIRTLVEDINSVDEYYNIVYTINKDSQLEIFNKNTGELIYKKDNIIAVSTTMSPDYIILTLNVCLGKGLNTGRYSKHNILDFHNILVNKETNKIEEDIKKVNEEVVKTRTLQDKYINI